MNFTDFQNDYIDFPNPAPLIRTHKAYCPWCGCMTTSYNPNERVITCQMCVKKV